MSFCFEYANKAQLKNILSPLFGILYENMSSNYPTGCTYEEDFHFWSSNFISSMNDVSRQLVIIFSDNSVIGYFQYSIIDDILKMEDLQVKKDYHGSGLFGGFYSWLCHGGAPLSDLWLFAGGRSDPDPGGVGV